MGKVAASISHKMIGGLFLVFALGCLPLPSVQVSTQSVTVNQTARSYRLVVPDGLPEGRPVVIAWHGFGDTAESMAKYSDLDRLADRHQFLLVYPEVEKGGWRYPLPGAPNTNADADVEFFDALLSDLPRHATIDLEHVYVVGMSQGATFAQWLASQRPRDIAAVVAHSGGAPKELDPAVFQVPIMLIAGTEDLVHDSMQQSAAKYKTEVEFVSVPGLGHAWDSRQNEAIWEFLSRHKRVTPAVSE
ncbi:alpha/beta hydrolase family esterase [Blastopirellula marina]|nr:alpha/beta fold hydrolase [Blastopirellula marina]